MNTNTFKLIYYSFLNIIGFGMCLVLAGFLSWPLLAEMPLILSIYVLFVAFGKYLFNSRLIQTDYDLASLVRDLRFQMKQQLEDVEKG